MTDEQMKRVSKEVADAIMKTNGLSDDEFACFVGAMMRNVVYTKDRLALMVKQLMPADFKFLFTTVPDVFGEIQSEKG